ncbi:MAG TPA: hypothetical protein VI934_00295 [Candidatus Nanoarchaeia archaeon]|nr:hypothetical protein [Candidatus Nanoarchaeia archaeon]
MEKIHYITNRGIASTGVDPFQQCLVAVPGSKELLLAVTYAGQLMPGYSVFMSLGNSSHIVEAILPVVEAEVVNQRERLAATQVDALSSNYRRAKPFLAYCDRERMRVSTKARENIERGQELSIKDMTELVNAVYDRLSSDDGANGSTKKAIMGYIQKAQAAQATLSWFSHHIDPILGKLAASYELEGGELERAVTGSVDQIKTGAYNGKVALGGLDDLNPIVQDSMHGLTGTEPGRQFLATIDQVVNGESDKGLIVPLNPRISNHVEIPEELRPHYIRTPELGRIITRFDRVIAAVLLAYAAENEQVQAIVQKLQSERRTVPYELLMRAVFPEGHKPTLTLYSDEITGINYPDMRRIVELVKEGRADIPKTIEKYFGIPKEEARFEELVSLQTDLMNLLPFAVYVCTGIYKLLSMSIPQARKHQAQLKQPQRALLRVFNAQESSLKRDFGVDSDSFKSPDAQTDGDIVRLFGDQFLFTKRITHKILQT